MPADPGGPGAPVELQSGHNRPWPSPALTASVTGARAAAVLLGPDRAGEWVDTASDVGGDVVLRLDRLAADVETVLVVAWDRRPGLAVTLSSDRGVEATFEPHALTVERAVIMVEVYRRAGAWKVRALGHGYAGGLAQLAQVHGVVVPDDAPASPPPAPPPSAGSVVPDLGRRFAMIVDDAASTTASMRSSVRFAEERLAADLETIAVDPAQRVGAAGELARSAAHHRHDELVRLARDRHRDDLDMLLREVAEVEAGLPLACADWNALTDLDVRTRDARHDAPHPAADETAGLVRLGHLALADSPLRVPVLARSPLGPAVWVEADDGPGEGPGSGRVVESIALRLVLAGADTPRVTVIAAGGAGRVAALGGTVSTLSGPGEIRAALDDLDAHVSLVSMAVGAGRLGDLPPEHRGRRVVVVTGFPVGLDDAGAAVVRRLVHEGAGCGVDVVVSGSDPAPLGNAVLDEVHASCFHLGSVPTLLQAGGQDAADWVLTADVGAIRADVRDALADVVRTRLAAH